MSWDLKIIPDRDRPRGAGLAFQSATSQLLTTAADKSVHLLRDPELPCAFCVGRGVLPKGGTCPVCGGRKAVRVRPPAVHCAFCRGRGQYPPRSGLTCWVCNGRGIVAVHGLVTTCPDCRGAGRRPTESLYCRRCGGVGVVNSG